MKLAVFGCALSPETEANAPEVAYERDSVGQLLVPLDLLDQVVCLLDFLGRRSHGTWNATQCMSGSRSATRSQPRVCLQRLIRNM